MDGVGRDGDGGDGLGGAVGRGLYGCHLNRKCGVSDVGVFGFVDMSIRDWVGMEYADVLAWSTRICLASIMIYNESSAREEDRITMHHVLSHSPHYQHLPNPRYSMMDENAWFCVCGFILSQPFPLYVSHYNSSHVVSQSCF